MNLDKRPVLSIEPEMDATRVHVLERGTVPTVHIRVGHYITVEIDITRPYAPVSMLIHDLEEGAVNLCDLLGTTTARGLIRRAGNAGSPAAYIGQDPLTFEPGSSWAGLIAAAYQDWGLFWNPLPMDPALAALDMVVASHQNRAFGGSKIAMEHAPTALPAVQTLKRALEAGHIAAEAKPTVQHAIAAFDQSLLPGMPEPESIYSLPDALSESRRTEILRHDSPSPPPPGLILTGSPDWRLTGHGPVSTAEDTIQLSAHHRNSAAVTITAPIAANATGALPAYEALVTEPHTGELLAYATLKATNGRLFRGHAIPSRPIRPTDHLDIRHPLLHGKPEADPDQRKIDRTNREKAREAIQQRLNQPDYSCAIPPTLTELALNGHLLVSAEATIEVPDPIQSHLHGQNHSNSLDGIPSPTDAEFDWFLFELSTASQPNAEVAEVTRGGQEVARAGNGTAMERTFRSAAFNDTEIKAAFDDDGSTLRITLRRFPFKGQQVSLKITLGHPDGTTSTYTTESQTSRSKGIALKYTLTNFKANIEINGIALRAHR